MRSSELLKTHFFETVNLFNEKSDNANNFIVVTLGSINLGNKITLYFNCCQATKIVQDIKFKVYGNPYLIASLSYISQSLINKPLTVALDFASPELIKIFKIPATKKYSAYMVEDVLKLAIKKWQENYDS